jgi:hypothetical protein
MLTPEGFGKSGLPDIFCGSAKQAGRLSGMYKMPETA